MVKDKIIMEIFIQMILVVYNLQIFLLFLRIERVEVVRGPMSTLYGADAMGWSYKYYYKKYIKRVDREQSVSRTFQTDSSWGNKDTQDVSIMGTTLLKNKLGLSLRGSFYDNEESNLNGQNNFFNGADAINQMIVLVQMENYG